MPGLTLLVDAPGLLAPLRDRSTGTAPFRDSCDAAFDRCLEALAAGIEASAGPDAPAEPALVVPVLRAGLAGVGAALARWPGIALSPAGLFRHEDTLAPEWYLAPALDGHPAGSIAVVLEVIVATGNTTAAVCDKILQAGMVPVVACVLAARQGCTLLNRAGVDVYTLGLDEHLDDRGYLVPGLGDAGDRWCGAARTR